MTALRLYEPPASVTGTRGRYDLTEFLGRGGFGESYRATAADGTPVTVKVLRLERLDSWKSLELFEREGRALAALHHPRIPSFVELFVSDGAQVRALAAGESVTHALASAPSPAARVILVQSYVPGRSLQAHLDAGERLDPAAAERLAFDLLDILDYLHRRAGEQPFIHRDLKPSNVILDATGAAYLIDFGAIQMRVRAEGDSGSTMIGTAGYFPTEQLLGRALPSSDLYALGMTLLAALTGRPPEEQPIDPSTSKVRPPPGLPPRLAAFLDAVLEPSPGRRPASALAARGILDGSLAHQLAVRWTPPAPLTTRQKGQRTAFGVIGGAGLAGAPAMYTVFFKHLSETKLVQLAPFWVTPVLFGASGLLALRWRKPALPVAIGATALGLIGLYLVLAAAF